MKIAFDWERKEFPDGIFFVKYCPDKERLKGIRVLAQVRARDDGLYDGMWVDGWITKNIFYTLEEAKKWADDIIKEMGYRTVGPYYSVLL